VRNIDSEAVHAAVEPETQDAREVGLDDVVVPVEVGLLGGEEVQVVLLTRLVERPGRAAESRLPVVRRSAVPARTEEVAGAVGVGLIRDRVPEPGMLVRRVVRDDVDDDSQPKGVCVFDEPIESETS
jgi:hypothetical protein